MFGHLTFGTSLKTHVFEVFRARRRGKPGGKRGRALGLRAEGGLRTGGLGAGGQTAGGLRVEGLRVGGP